MGIGWMRTGRACLQLVVLFAVAMCWGCIPYGINMSFVPSSAPHLGIASAGWESDGPLRD
jgi:hypothetical protein